LCQVYRIAKIEIIIKILLEGVEEG